MKIVATLFACVFILFIQNSIAQETRTVTIPNGTLVVVKTVQDYSSESLKTGQEIVAVVALDVFVDEDTVIKAGAPVFCLVQDASSSGMVGSGGELTIAFQNTIAIDGTPIPLTGNLVSKGESSTGEKVAVGVVLCPLALLCSGEEAALPAGIQGRAFTISDRKIKIKKYN